MIDFDERNYVHLLFIVFEVLSIWRGTGIVPSQDNITNL